MSNPQLSALVTVREAAEYLHVSTQTVRRWARDDLLKYVRVGNDYRIVRDSVPKIPMQQGNVEKLERRSEPLIAIARNTNSGIRILPKQAETKPKCKPTESIPQIGVSIQEAAKMLGISRPHFYPLIKEGKVRTVKIGRRTLVSVQSLRDFVDGSTEPGNLVKNTAELQGRK